MYQRTQLNIAEDVSFFTYVIFMRTLVRMKFNTASYTSQIWYCSLHYGNLVQHSRYTDSLLAGQSGDLIPIGLRFSATVQTAPGANSSSGTMGTGSLPEVKRPGRGLDHPHPSTAEVKERVDLNLYSPSGPSWPVLGWTLPFTLLQFIVINP